MKASFSKVVMRVGQNLIDGQVFQLSAAKLSKCLGGIDGVRQTSKNQLTPRRHPETAAYGNTYRVWLYIGFVLIFPPFDLVMFFARFDLSLHDLVLEVSLLLSSLLLTSGVVG